MHNTYIRYIKENSLQEINALFEPLARCGARAGLVRSNLTTVNGVLVLHYNRELQALVRVVILVMHALHFSRDEYQTRMEK